MRTLAWARGSQARPCRHFTITVARVESIARGTQEKAAAIGAATEASLSFSVSLSLSRDISSALACPRTPVVQPSLFPVLPSHPKSPLPPVGSVALSILGFGVVSTGWVWGRAAAAAEPGGEA